MDSSSTFKSFLRGRATTMKQRILRMSTINVKKQRHMRPEAIGKQTQHLASVSKVEALKDAVEYAWTSSSPSFDYSIGSPILISSIITFYDTSAYYAPLLALTLRVISTSDLPSGIPLFHLLLADYCTALCSPLVLDEVIRGNSALWFNLAGGCGLFDLSRRFSTSFCKPISEISD